MNQQTENKERADKGSTGTINQPHQPNQPEYKDKPLENLQSNVQTKDMAVRILQIVVCAVSLVSLQGCFFWHSTTVRDNPPSQTTTVYHEPTGDAVAVTTTH